MLRVVLGAMRDQSPAATDAGAQRLQYDALSHVDRTDDRCLVSDDASSPRRWLDTAQATCPKSFSFLSPARVAFLSSSARPSADDFHPLQNASRFCTSLSKGSGDFLSVLRGSKWSTLSSACEPRSSRWHPNAPIAARSSQHGSPS